MKGTVLSVLLSILLFVPVLIFADSLTLDTEETLQVPTSRHMDWYIDRIDVDAKLLRIRYRWRGNNQEVIWITGARSPWLTWECRNIEVPGENIDCVAAGDPHPCCTGVGIGTCDDMEDTCFTDVFGFVIRAQDVGTGIGVGLRTLIWNQMKQDVLTPGNDGNFD